MTLLPVHRVDADVAIVGSGFSGALVALALRRLGRSVVLLERGRHPRFAIGESSTPLANLLLEEIADRYDLPRVRPLSKWGTWQRRYPEIACGLKRGFSFFRHDPGRLFADDSSHARQLLVAASPRDEIADTHWYRPDVDHFLVREAEREGAEYLDETMLDGVRFEGDTAILDGQRLGQSIRVAARFIVDASGPRGFLHRALGLEATPTTWLPPTQGLYSHFVDVERWDQLTSGRAGRAGRAGKAGKAARAGEAGRAGLDDDAPLSDQNPPYPVDDAAVHHVFPGGWIWMLRFNNGITSAGAAVTDDLARELRLADGAPAWERLLARVPSVGAQFLAARAVLPFIHAPCLAFRCRTLCGPRWALLPSAAGVIDPLLSTGFPLTLLGASRLVEILDRTWSGSEREDALATYARQTLDELDATEQLVAALYASMADFTLFKKLSLLYFAAATFSETARRLGRPEGARGFLLCADAQFGPELRACADTALARPVEATRDDLLARINRAIAPVDVAGLGDRSRRDWYPVLADDLLAAGPKLGATDDELRGLVERCGLAEANAFPASAPILPFQPIPPSRAGASR